MNDIQLYDKKFEVFIKADELKHIVSSLAKKINESNLENPLFIVVLNGSFLFFALPNTFSRYFLLPSIILFLSKFKYKNEYSLISIKLKFFVSLKCF